MLYDAIQRLKHLFERAGLQNPKHRHVPTEVALPLFHRDALPPLQGPA